MNDNDACKTGLTSFLNVCDEDRLHVRLHCSAARGERADAFTCAVGFIQGTLALFEGYEVNLLPISTPWVSL